MPSVPRLLRRRQRHLGATRAARCGLEQARELPCDRGSARPRDRRRLGRTGRGLALLLGLDLHGGDGVDEARWDAPLPIRTGLLLDLVAGDGFFSHGGGSPAEASGSAPRTGTPADLRIPRLTS